MAKLTLAIHQPNYLPWLGYFYKIYRADTFVFLDNVEFSKRSPTRRVHIRREKNSRNQSYLIVPLQQHADNALIHELRIDHGQDWQTRQLNQLRNTYSKAPFFTPTFEAFRSWMAASIDFPHLATFNQFLIEELAGLIGLETDFYRSSNCLPADQVDNLSLAQHFGTSVYLSGQGGKKYQDETAFRESGITIRYLDAYTFLEENPYPQHQGPWLNGLSVIDALMNIGAEGIRDLFENSPGPAG